MAGSGDADVMDCNAPPGVTDRLDMQGRGAEAPLGHARPSGRGVDVVQKRKLIEQGFGWAKTVGRMRQVMVRGLKRVDQIFVLSMAAYNLVRMRSLGQICPQLQ